jgi:hypothetical protein
VGAVLSCKPFGGLSLSAGRVQQKSRTGAIHWIQHPWMHCTTPIPAVASRLQWRRC